MSYGYYVWSAYGIAAVIFLGLRLRLRQGLRQAKKEVRDASAP